MYVCTTKFEMIVLKQNIEYIERNYVQKSHLQFFKFYLIYIPLYRFYVCFWNTIILIMRALSNCFDILVCTSCFERQPSSSLIQVITNYDKTLVFLASYFK